MSGRQIGNSNQKTKYWILAAICGVVMLGCVVWLVMYLTSTSRAERRMGDIRNKYVQENNTGGSVQEDIIGKPVSTDAPDDKRQTDVKQTEQTKEEEERQAALEKARKEEEERQAMMELYQVPEKSIDFAALKAEQNKDIYAWITVPGTKVDYPVLQSPDKQDYYLNYNIDGTKGLPGCIYSENINSKDFTDRNTVLYGHNMKNGTMFAGLHSYGDPVFFQEHPYVYVYTETGILVYQVFAACKYNSIHLLKGYDISTLSYFKRYINSLYSTGGLRDNYNMDLKGEFDEDSRVLTLSTCIGDDSKRWLVSTVLKQEIAYEKKQGE